MNNWKKEFDKKFVTKCSDGLLMADFKNGREVKVKHIKQFITSLLLKQKKELIEKLKSECIGEENKPHTLSSENAYEYMKWSDGYNKKRDELINIFKKYDT